MTKRQKMTYQNEKERIKNFNEVALGYSEKDAVDEASRCLGCKKAPCKKGCPAQVLIPEFIKEVKNKNFEKAYKILKEKNNLPAVCGRVCPQETQCEIECVLKNKDQPVAIGRLERFVADFGARNNLDKDFLKKDKNNKKIAVVGSGPSGITCAADLASAGYTVVLFEGLHVPGGVMVYGIPEFRLPKEIVSYEIDCIKKMGVEIKLNTLFGKNYTLKDLKNEGFSALYIASGAGLPKFMNIDGEELNNCYSANEFLTRINLLKAYNFPEFKTPVYAGRKCIVTGGGNVAMDAARSARRLGADVTVVYRRTRKEMPARVEEVEHAFEEGVKFNFLCNPVRYEGDKNGNVKKALVEKMKLGEPDDSGRRRPLPTGNFFELEADSVVVAIGNNPNPLIKREFPELKTTDWGTFIVDDNYMTSIEGVFAGGDITTGAATVIEAIGAGKTAATSIIRFLDKGRSL
ncbi:MAG: NADPH-dependent glutamate synthase [Candidatus Muiribacteriota bacterium]